MSQPDSVSVDSISALVYRIDGANRITWVNETWNEFARANNGEALLPGAVIGLDLFASLSDPTVRELYAAMIRQVRAGGKVRFDYRCDAPDKRRTFTMEIRSRPDAEVEFVSTLRREESRSSITLLEPETPRDDERFIRMCSWCQDVSLPSGAWVPVEEAVRQLNFMEVDRLPRITHTMCQPCYLRVMSDLGLA